MRSLLKWKEQLFVEPYDKYVYCSPNLNQDAFHTREHSLQAELQALCSPFPCLFQNTVPNLDDVYSYVENEKTRVLFLVDDFNEVTALV